MRCRRVQRRLSAWIDRELAVRDATAIEHHLNRCACCRAVATELRRLVRLARTEHPYDAPAHLLPRVLAELELRPARRQRWRPVAAATGAVVALTVLLAIWSALPGPHDNPAPAPRQRAEAPHEARLAEHDRELLAGAQHEFARAEAHYQRAIQKLRRAAAEDSAGWKPSRRHSYMQTLSSIQDAVDRFRRTAQIAPADPAAHELLFGAYRRQMRFLQDAILDVPALASGAALELDLP